MAKDKPFELPRESLQHLYLSSLGQFISLFSLTESMLKKVLAKTAGVDDRIAVALFSGTRADQACSFIRRCYEARGEKIPRELDSLLAQMAVVNAFRNDAVHYDADFKSDPPVVTNRGNTLNPNAIRETEIKPTTLRDAGHDLGWIILGLSAYLRDEMTPEDADNLAAALGQPWRHKSPSPASRGQTRRTPKPRPARKLQQKPYEG